MKGKSGKSYSGKGGQSESKGTDGVVFKFEKGGSDNNVTTFYGGMFPEIYYQIDYDEDVES